MKKYILYSVGAIQYEMEGLIGTENIEYYVDDHIDDKAARIGSLKHIVKSSEELARDKQKYPVIICEQLPGDYINRLEQLGFCEDEYLTYNQYLLDYDANGLLSMIQKRPIAVYGIGKTYEDYKKLIETELGQVKYLVDGVNTGKDGIMSLQDISDETHELFFLVTSTYYPVIAEELKKRGYKHREDFLFIDTFFHLNKKHKMVYGQSDFIDRRKNVGRVLFVLAGYKEELWDKVFARVYNFVPENYEICVLSSGRYVKKLDYICESNGWSYLYTKRNNVSLILNIAICLYGNAQLICKMDEDIFLTRGVLEHMEETCHKVQEQGNYQVGFVSPLINVNTYGYIRVMDRLHMRNKWIEKFGIPKYTNGIGHHRAIWKEAEAAELLWGGLPFHIEWVDEVNELLAQSKAGYSICHCRYSIGLIMFERDLWMKMGMFPVDTGNGVGLDEQHICSYCMFQGKAMVVDEERMVGHLAYGNQYEEMKRRYLDGEGEI